MLATGPPGWDAWPLPPEGVHVDSSGGCRFLFHSRLSGLSFAMPMVIPDTLGRHSSWSVVGGVDVQLPSRYFLQSLCFRWVQGYGKKESEPSDFNADK